MKKLKVAMLICIAMLVCSCGTKREFSKTTEQFWDLIKSGKIDSLETIYPSIPELKNFVHFENYAITKIEEINVDSAKVYVCLESTNRLGDQMDNSAVLYLSRLREPIYLYDVKFDTIANEYVEYVKDSILPGKVLIADSKGLYEIDKEGLIYKYAVNTGCITDADSTDMAVLSKINASHRMFFQNVSSVLKNIEDNLTITQWSWDSSYYSDSASGDGICKNNSLFTVSHPRYKVTFLDRYGNVITTEEGEIADKLLPGKYKSFSFYTSYAPRAMRARIAVDFDKDAIFEELLTADYDGTEYQKYLKTNL